MATQNFLKFKHITALQKITDRLNETTQKFFGKYVIEINYNYFMKTRALFYMYVRTFKNNPKGCVTSFNENVKFSFPAFSDLLHQLFVETMIPIPDILFNIITKCYSLKLLFF